MQGQSNPAGTNVQPESAAQSAGAQAAPEETRITPEQAQELFRSVDSILQFASKDTGYAIDHPVKRRLVTRDEVVQYLTSQMQKGRAVQRLQRSELVLKKFGLLDEDFHLQPFLIQLLREQIAGYYDARTKTVNLLDWIGPEAQKPVLAHELTHALQDQHVNLEKWEQQTLQSTAKNVAQDNEHLAKDEDDTARDAVLEGQAMAVFIDYALAPAGKNLLTAPDLVAKMKQEMTDNSGSPVMARAPLLLQESLVFSYREGLDFITAVLQAKGKDAAFAGTLDHPPSSTYQILTPRAYLDHAKVPLLTMPDIHGLLGQDYRPYDIGVMGELDVRMLTALFSGQQAASALAPAWRGGIYYAAQSKQAKTGAEKDSTASLGLLYLSRWATPEAAQGFATIYATEIGRKYDHVTAHPPVAQNMQDPMVERTWDTSEGPVLIAVSGRTVFISESFPLPLAHKLEFVMMGSVAGSTQSVVAAKVQPREELTAGLRWSLGQAGLPWLAMRSVEQATQEATQAANGPGRAVATRRLSCTELSKQAARALY
ncbi:MAG: hypothetical protein ACP5EP_05870 [Acidobacteriaceae bacterium]